MKHYKNGEVTGSTRIQKAEDMKIPSISIPIPCTSTHRSKLESQHSKKLYNGLSLNTQDNIKNEQNSVLMSYPQLYVITSVGMTLNEQQDLFRRQKNVFEFVIGNVIRHPYLN